MVSIVDVAGKLKNLSLNDETSTKVKQLKKKSLKTLKDVMKEMEAEDGVLERKDNESSPTLSPEALAEKLKNSMNDEANCLKKLINLRSVSLERFSRVLDEMGISSYVSSSPRNGDEDEKREESSEEEAVTEEEDNGTYTVEWNGSNKAANTLEVKENEDEDVASEHQFEEEQFSDEQDEASADEEESAEEDNPRLWNNEAQQEDDDDSEIQRSSEDEELSTEEDKGNEKGAVKNDTYVNGVEEDETSEEASNLDSSNLEYSDDEDEADDDSIEVVSPFEEAMTGLLKIREDIMEEIEALRIEMMETIKAHRRKTHEEMEEMGRRLDRLQVILEDGSEETEEEFQDSFHDYRIERA